MSAVAVSEREGLERRARRLAWLGEGWHLIELVLALVAGILAGSVALEGFGLQTGGELLAGILIVWRFSQRRIAVSERRAQQAMSLLYYALAVYVGLAAALDLVEGKRPSASWLGVALALVAITTMPLLATAKRRVGRRLHSVATIKEAGQNQLCAYLGVALLVGLVLNAVFSLWWADPAAGLVIALVCLREGRESWLGRGCCADCAQH